MHNSPIIRQALIRLLNTVETGHPNNSAEDARKRGRSYKVLTEREKMEAAEIKRILEKCN